MNNSTDFKSLWKQQAPAAAPELKALLDKAKALKKKTRNGIIGSNILLASTAAFIVYVIISFHPERLTTKLGALLVILAIAVFLVVRNQLLAFLSKEKLEENSRDYLEHLMRLRQKQQFLQTSVLSAYFILLGAGIALYMIEYASRMTLLWGSVTYLVTFAWIAFNWFYIRPRTIRKQSAALNELIAQLEKLSSQVNAGENEKQD